MKQIQCPHKMSYSNIHHFCMNGKFPMNCEECDCPDKKEIDVTITTSFASTDDFNLPHISSTEGKKSPIRERYDRIKDSEWFKKTHEGMSVGEIEEIEEEHAEELLYVCNKTAERTKKEFIQKACEWLKDHAYEYPYYLPKDGQTIQINIWDDFKKAMEE